MSTPDSATTPWSTARCAINWHGSLRGFRTSLRQATVPSHRDDSERTEGVIVNTFTTDSMLTLTLALQTAILVTTKDADAELAAKDESPANVAVMV